LERNIYALVSSIGTLQAWLREYDPHATEFAADLLLHFAFSNNPDGVVITSMFSASHVEHNYSLAAKSPTPELAAKVHSLVQNDRGASVARIDVVALAK
jgi:hypothetical protein